jgi:phosphotriesterase-related protein
MSRVMTVLGPVNPDALGITDIHEHLICCPPPLQRERDPDLILDSEDKAAQELRWFGTSGGQTLVEWSTVDYGRDATILRRLSSTTGIQVIAVTGYLRGEYCAHLVTGKTVNQLVDLMVQEIYQGIKGTDIKAGVIKAGSGMNSIDAFEEKVLRAAARAQRETGAPIGTHTSGGTMGVEQVQILLQEGAEPRKILIGHLDRNLDWNYHLLVASMGVFLGYDNISKEEFAQDRTRIMFIRQLIQHGLGDHILLGCDLARRSYWPGYNGGPGMMYLLWRFVPWMRREGISAEDIERLLILNPARFLSFIV